MKKCPFCKTASLSQGYLKTYQCVECGGIWISINDRMSQVSLKSLTATSRSMPEAKQANLCPDCGRTLGQHKIWPNLAFNLGRCANCQGIWFNQQEWQLLKSRGLQYQVNTFFTQV